MTSQTVGFGDLPTDIISTIALLLQHPQAIYQLHATSRELHRVVEPITLSTSLDFTLTSKKYKEQYFEELIKLGVDLRKTGTPTELLNLRKTVWMLYTNNVFYYNYNTVLSKLDNLSSTASSTPSPLLDEPDFESRIVMYDKFIALYLQICNFPNTHKDIYYLMKLYFEKSKICYHKLKEIYSDQVKKLFDQANYNRFELLKILLCIHIKSPNKIDFEYCTFDRVLEEITDHTNGFSEGIDGYTLKDTHAQLCCLYLRYSIASTPHRKSYFYTRVSQMFQSIYLSTNVNTIISFETKKYKHSFEKIPAYKNTVLLNVMKCIGYILTKSKTKLLSNRTVVSYF